VREGGGGGSWEEGERERLCGGVMGVVGSALGWGERGRGDGRCRGGLLASLKREMIVDIGSCDVECVVYVTTFQVFFIHLHSFLFLSVSGRGGARDSVYFLFFQNFFLLFDVNWFVKPPLKLGIGLLLDMPFFLFFSTFSLLFSVNCFSGGRAFLLLFSPLFVVS